MLSQAAMPIQGYGAMPAESGKRGSAGSWNERGLESEDLLEMQAAVAGPSTLPSTGLEEEQDLIGRRIPKRRRRRIRTSDHSSRASIASTTAAVLGSTLLLFATPPGISPVQAQSIPAALSTIDFSALGQVGIVGAFSALELYNNSLSTSIATRLNGSQLNPGASTLLQRANNGSLTLLGATDLGGEIRSLCQLEPQNGGGGSGQPALYVGGNFSQIGGVSARNVARYDPSTGAFDGIAGGINGSVQTVYCDSTQQTVLFGGNFSAPALAPDPASYLGNVALWNVPAANWSAPPFGGLNGEVRTISQGVNASVIRFGGSFTAPFSSNATGAAQGAGTSMTSSTSASSTASATGGAVNGTAGMVPGTNNGTSPSSITAGFAPISLAQSETTGGPASSIPGFSDPAQIFCPQGPDGPGTSYLFQDGIDGQLIVRTFRQTDARAFRIGNTGYEGRGTSAFRIVAIPDNTVLDLLYLDPTTGQNATCRESCPLAPASVVPYQDFLIADTPNNNAAGGIASITGFQFNVLGHTGAGAGLHILELLSSGAWAYANNAGNRGACNSPEAGVSGTNSRARVQGAWASATYSSGAETRQSFLALTDSSANIRARASDAVTFDVSVPITGDYSVYLQVPGCEQTNTCGQRTDVQVTVFGAPGSSGQSTIVSQAVQQTTSVLVYEGQVQSSTANFMPSVVVSLPPNAAAPQSQSFTIVADKVNMVLRTSRNLFLPVLATNSFGLFEYNLFDATPSSGISPNRTGTALNAFAATLRQAGVSQQNGSAYVSSIVSVGNTTFVGGLFRTGGATSAAPPNTLTPVNRTGNDSVSLVSFTAASNGTALTRLANGGLLGSIDGMVTANGFLYIGGSFNQTADGTTALLNVARYDPQGQAWASLGQGLSGPVSSVSLLGDKQVLFTGNFSDTSLGSSTGGYAVWDTTTASWQPQNPLVLGSVAAGDGAPTTDQSSVSYVAGSFSLLASNGAPGAVTLVSPEQNGQPPMIQSLNFQYDSGTAPGIQSMVRRGKEAFAAFAQSMHLRSFDAAKAQGSLSTLPRWIQEAKVEQLHKRQLQAPASDPLSPPSLFSDDRNQIFATAFWKQQDGSSMQIIGGNFTTTANISNLGMYNATGSSLIAFPPIGRRSNGRGALTLVRALSVVNNTLFVGGDGGMQIFDLQAGTWKSNNAALGVSGGIGAASSTGNPQQASVTNLVHRPESDTVFAAGNFDSAGSLPCPSVCEWDMTSMRWQQLGTGFAGTITAMDFALNHAAVLVVAGSLFVNGVFASLAAWSFDNATWTPYGQIGTSPGQIPGPATAMSVNDFQLDAIFLGGRSSDGTRPFLVKWDGSRFEPIGGEELLPESGISQLTLFPISEAHQSNTILEDNRLLVVSGALSTRSSGNVSSALYDGNGWTPFLRAIELNGGSGVVRGVTRSNEVLIFPNLRQLAAGLVILISIAIGLGIVFLLVLLGLVWALTRRRSRENFAVPVSASNDSLSHPKEKPASLLATLNAATENVMGANDARSFGRRSDAGPTSAHTGGAMAAGAGAAAVAGAAANASGYNTSSSGHRGGGESSSHGRMDSAAFGTLDHSDETGQNSTVYHSDGAAARSAYYTTDSSQELHRQRNIGMGVAAGAAGAGAAAVSSSTAIDHGNALEGQRAQQGDWEEEMMAEQDPDQTQGFIAHARYSFEATHASELSVHAGQQIEILSDEDESWWLARDASGRRGVLPATYVL